MGTVWKGYYPVKRKGKGKYPWFGGETPLSKDDVAFLKKNGYGPVMTDLKKSLRESTMGDLATIERDDYGLGINRYGTIFAKSSLRKAMDQMRSEQVLE